jgi:5-methylcytosine-specific restriction endonuclease McrA
MMKTRNLCRCGFQHTFILNWRLQVVRIKFLRERDGDLCGICNERMLFDVHIHDDCAASVDHIIPISNKGCSCPNNLRLTHRWCNMKRANVPHGTELRLRGCAGHIRKLLRYRP